MASSFLACPGFLLLLPLTSLPLGPLLLDRELGKELRNSWQRYFVCLLYHLLFLHIQADYISQLPLQSVWLIKCHLQTRAGKSLCTWPSPPKVPAATALETTCSR